MDMLRWLVLACVFLAGSIAFARFYAWLVQRTRFGDMTAEELFRGYDAVFDAECVAELAWKRSEEWR